ncbi:hypothetical protein [Aquimarina algiphila]|uniref:Uncharacterized protein n=1 Tax=Aquimarina algiphila TaxID=2047982 RepID=A0A554VN21_9FLAO|nr:hypothetical protein [Aquimarina algiphila]TSE09737.1 hypothetical protein FOF46_06905 [Aquimarina algiphila]
MKDESKKHKDFFNIPEHTSIPFDLHYICVSEKENTDDIKKFHYMKKYKSKGVILDFYKKNSNILEIDI